MKKRKLKTCLLLLLIPALLLVLYVILDFPLRSAEAEYRLAEKAAMIGPGNILGVSAIQTNPSRELVVARTGYGVVLYDGETMYYRKDLGETVIPVLGPNQTVVLFDKFPEAVRAEVEITVVQPFTASLKAGAKIRAEAQREQDGYFLFASGAFAALRSTELFVNFPNPIPAQVRLFDAEGVLIADISTEILSPGIIAAREQGIYKPNHGYEE